MGMTPRELADQLRAELSEHLETIRHIADQIEAMDNTARMLAVPYRSQWGMGADAFQSDCGPASLAMLLEWKGTSVLVDALAFECGMSVVKPYTNAADLMRVASVHGLTLMRQQSLTVADLKAEISNGQPCIALINYGDLGDLRQDRSFAGTHWLVVIGVDDGFVTVNDPDWRNTGGAGLRIPCNVFDHAWGDTLPNGAPRQALLIHD